MSYEDTQCPCGGKKEQNTMLCADCCRAFADRDEMRVYANKQLDADYRRHSAIVLVALAHRRDPRLKYSQKPKAKRSNP